MKQFILDYEVVDGITKGNLIDVRDNLRADLEAYSKTGKDTHGFNIHPDDLVNNLVYLEAVKKVLEYFGVRD